MGWKILKNFAKENKFIILSKKKKNYKNSLELLNLCKIKFIYMQIICNRSKCTIFTFPPQRNPEKISQEKHSKERSLELCMYLQGGYYIFLDLQPLTLFCSKVLFIARISRTFYMIFYFITQLNTNQNLLKYIITLVLTQIFSQ